MLIRAVRRYVILATASRGQSGSPTCFRGTIKSMISVNRLRAIWLSLVVFAFFGGTAAAQSTQPFLQDIKVQTPETTEDPDLVKKISAVSPSTAVHANSSIQALADVDIPGYTGILVQKMDGTNVVEIGNLAAARRKASRAISSLTPSIS